MARRKIPILGPSAFSPLPSVRHRSIVSKKAGVMKHIRIAHLLLVAAIALSGCAAIKPQLRSVTTTFGDPAFKTGGTLAVIAADAAQNNSLEFAHFKALIGDRLAASGYAVIGDVSSAQQIAIVSYGIDNGRVELVSVPVYGQTNWPFYGSGTFFYGGRHGAIGANLYTMPQYGIVGTTTETFTSYSRVLALDIVDGPSFRANATKRLLEVRTRSEGGCGTMAVILPSLVQATFAVFPGEYGKARVDVRALPDGFVC